MLETLADKDLIKKYLDGEEKSLEILISRYLKAIYNFIYKNVGSAVDAEDITQEVFLKVWKNLKKFDQNKNLKPWIFQIAKNTSIDFLRKRKTIPFSRFEQENGQNPISDNIATKPIDLISKLSNKQSLMVIMQGLSQKEQKVISLRHIEGMSFNEIADNFKESVNTVKSRYRRGMINLEKNAEKNQNLFS